MHVGGLSQARGLFLMLDVMAALEPELPVVLYLAGRYAHAADEEKVRARVAGELAGRVILLGELDPGDVPSYLAAADVAWSPILSGPQFAKPNVLTKIYEGMAAGAATLVSNVADHGEPVRREQCGLSVPPSVDGHVSGVRRLLAAGDEVKAMGERGRRAVRERYSWEAIEGQLIGFYDRLLDGASADEYQ
jgi:glycosyltransferase involved in cell wall biosynthesis